MLTLLFFLFFFFVFFFFFFFQAEDGIRDTSVTRVQTCALPISRSARSGTQSIASISSATTPRRTFVFMRAPVSKRGVSIARPSGDAAIGQRHAQRGAEQEQRRQQGPHERVPDRVRDVAERERARRLADQEDRAEHGDDHATPRLRRR